MVEGAVLHHQDHNVVDIGQQARIERVLWVFRERFELTRRDDVIEDQGLAVAADRQYVKIAADQPGRQDAGDRAEMVIQPRIDLAFDAILGRLVSFRQ